MEEACSIVQKLGQWRERTSRDDVETALAYRLQADVFDLHFQSHALGRRM